DGDAPGVGAARVEGPFGDVSSAAFAPDGTLLVCARPRGGGGGLFVGGDGGSWKEVEGAAPAGWDVREVASLVPRARPQGHLGTRDPALGHGWLLGLDGRPDHRGSGRRVRLRALEGPFFHGLVPPGRALGEAPLAPDGSFFLQVPADVPLLLDLLDAQGRVEIAGRTPFWVGSNEVRACIGCHEEPETAPANRRPQAVEAGAVPLLGTGALR
ncbi:MAG: hypothetical protein ACC662_10580, partial [Planctomycetota bacterium]